MQGEAAGLPSQLKRGERPGRTEKERWRPRQQPQLLQANELTSITLQLVGIRLRFTHKVSVWTRGGGVWTAAHAPAAKQREVEKCREPRCPTLISDKVFLFIWSCQKTSSNLHQTSTLMDVWRVGGFHHQM